MSDWQRIGVWTGAILLATFFCAALGGGSWTAGWMEVGGQLIGTVVLGAIIAAIAGIVWVVQKATKL